MSRIDERIKVSVNKGKPVDNTNGWKLCVLRFVRMMSKVEGKQIEAKTRKKIQGVQATALCSVTCNLLLSFISTELQEVIFKHIF